MVPRAEEYLSNTPSQSERKLDEELFLDLILGLTEAKPLTFSIEIGPAEIDQKYPAFYEEKTISIEYYECNRLRSLPNSYFPLRDCLKQLFSKISQEDCRSGTIFSMPSVDRDCILAHLVNFFVGKAREEGTELCLVVQTPSGSGHLLITTTGAKILTEPREVHRFCCREDVIFLVNSDLPWDCQVQGKLFFLIGPSTPITDWVHSTFEQFYLPSWTCDELFAWSRFRSMAHLQGDAFFERFYYLGCTPALLDPSTDLRRFKRQFRKTFEALVTGFDFFHSYGSIFGCTNEYLFLSILIRDKSFRACSVHHCSRWVEKKSLKSLGKLMIPGEFGVDLSLARLLAMAPLGQHAMRMISLRMMLRICLLKLYPYKGPEICIANFSTGHIPSHLSATLQIGLVFPTEGAFATDGEKYEMYLLDAIGTADGSLQVFIKSPLVPSHLTSKEVLYRG